MAYYVDGFVIPVPRKNLPAYLKLAKVAAKVWKGHGALDYKECVGDDMDIKFCLPFPKGIRSKPDEVILFSYIVFKSRAHRDRVNKKVMADPRISESCDPNNMPMDAKRMLYGGFKSVVSV